MTKNRRHVGAKLWLVGGSLFLLCSGAVFLSLLTAKQVWDKGEKCKVVIVYDCGAVDLESKRAGVDSVSRATARMGNCSQVAMQLEGALAAAGCSVVVKRVELCDEEHGGLGLFLDAGVIVIGTPTYASNMSWRIKKFLDTTLHKVYRRSEVKDKVLSAFTSTGSKMDGERCLQALGWAFSHAGAKTVEGLVIVDGTSPEEIKRACAAHARKIVLALEKVHGVRE